MAQQEKINEVHGEEQDFHEEFNASGDDGIKIINANTFPVHLQFDANGDSIIRSVLERPFVKFRYILNKNQLEEFFRNSCFGHFLDLPIDSLSRFQMTIVYELLNRMFNFENPNKKDEIVINYCGMPVFFGKREFVIVTGLKPSSS